MAVLLLNTHDKKQSAKTGETHSKELSVLPLNVLDNKKSEIQVTKKAELKDGPITVLEKDFNEKYKKLDSLTDELNSFSISGNAPESLKEEYSKARSQVISAHKKYLKKVNEQITQLSKKEQHI